MLGKMLSIIKTSNYKYSVKIDKQEIIEIENLKNVVQTIAGSDYRVQDNGKYFLISHNTGRSDEIYKKLTEKQFSYTFCIKPSCDFDESKLKVFLDKHCRNGYEVKMLRNVYHVYHNTPNIDYDMFDGD
jgi:hypothetical protein